MAVDVEYDPDGKQQPIVIFAHGFKGFKDWGHFAVLGKHFVKAGFALIRFNFSHNGTTPEKPTEFADLEAFGENRVRFELEDLGHIIDFALGSDELSDLPLDRSGVHLIGHSRGGGSVILKAAQDARVQKVVSWAGISTFGRYPGSEESNWREEGVKYILNGRTGQQMPLYFAAYQEYLEHPGKYSIGKALSELDSKNYLQIHGGQDEAVKAEEYNAIRAAAPGSAHLLIEPAGHTFGSKHPRPSDELPKHLQLAVQRSIEFLKS